MRWQLFKGCHQELSNVMSQKFLNFGEVKVNSIGRPINSVAMHPHVGFFDYGSSA